jgi:hypothetical protein
MEMAPTGHPFTASCAQPSSSFGTVSSCTRDMPSITLKILGHGASQFPEPTQTLSSTLIFMFISSFLYVGASKTLRAVFLMTEHLKNYFHLTQHLPQFFGIVTGKFPLPFERRQLGKIIPHTVESPSHI